MNAPLTETKSNGFREWWDKNSWWYLPESVYTTEYIMASRVWRAALVYGKCIDDGVATEKYPIGSTMYHDGQMYNVIGKQVKFDENKAVLTLAPAWYIHPDGTGIACDSKHTAEVEYTLFD